MTDTQPHILVTGGTRGIGAAIVSALADRGAKVVAHGSRDAATSVGADLAVPGAADGLWERALERLEGRIDVLINNAGVFESVAVDAPAAEWSAAWARTMQINLQAAADLCRRAVLHAKGRAAPIRIVNIASRAAHRGDSPAHWHYAASKGAMVAMTKTLARAYAAEGVLAYAISPGFVMTGMAQEYLSTRGGEQLLADIPLGRVAEPAEVAKVAAFLALDAPASMTGAVLDINGASYVR
jgi:3-oxoacyl-[acyl-carrier protein] reductase